MRIALYISLLLCCFAVNGQVEYYSASNTGELVRANAVDCQSQSLGIFQTFIDIAITPNGKLYGLSYAIFELNVADHTVTPIGIPMNSSGMYCAGTGLTALDNEHLISDRFDSLFVINIADGSAAPLGKTGYFCLGDLALHEGKIYMVSETNNLIRIALDPDSHLITGVENLGVLQTPSGMIYSLFSAFETCTSADPSLFAIDNNRVFRIDPANAAVTEVCTLNTDLSYGGAAITGENAPTAPDVTIPNVFTPNSDGSNDVFTVPGFTEVSSFTVLNRWGQVVYDSGGKTVSWDGTSTDGTPLEEGVYFYSAVTDHCYVTQKLHGFISLVR